MIQKVLQSGNSLVVSLPKKFVKTLGIKKGDEVKVEKRVDRGTLVFTFGGVRQLTLK